MYCVCGLEIAFNALFLTRALTHVSFALLLRIRVLKYISLEELEKISKQQQQQSAKDSLHNFAMGIAGSRGKCSFVVAVVSAIMQEIEKSDVTRRQSYKLLRS